MKSVPVQNTNSKPMPDVYRAKAIATRRRRRESDQRWIIAFNERRAVAKAELDAILAAKQVQP